MKISFSEKLNSFKTAINKNFGIIGIGAIFIIVGFVLIYIGFFKAESNFLVGFGLTFLSFTSFFLIYTIPSNFKYYYEQEITKKYGSYTYAKVIDKKIHDYSHTSNTFESGKPKHHEDFLYTIGFKFEYQNTPYYNECFFEERSTFDKIDLNTKLPIQFLKNNPNTVKLRRRKLSTELGIPENMCQ